MIAVIADPLIPPVCRDRSGRSGRRNSYAVTRNRRDRRDLRLPRHDLTLSHADPSADQPHHSKTIPA